MVSSSVCHKFFCCLPVVGPFFYGLDSEQRVPRPDLDEIENLERPEAIAEARASIERSRNYFSSTPYALVGHLLTLAGTVTLLAIPVLSSFPALMCLFYGIFISYRTIKNLTGVWAFVKLDAMLDGFNQQYPVPPPQEGAQPEGA